MVVFGTRLKHIYGSCSYHLKLYINCSPHTAPQTAFSHLVFKVGFWIRWLSISCFSQCTSLCHFPTASKHITMSQKIKIKKVDVNSLSFCWHSTYSNLCFLSKLLKTFNCTLMTYDIVLSGLLFRYRITFVDPPKPFTWTCPKKIPLHSIAFICAASWDLQIIPEDLIFFLWLLIRAESNVLLIFN